MKKILPIAILVVLGIGGWLVYRPFDDPAASIRPTQGAASAVSQGSAPALDVDETSNAPATAMRAVPPLPPSGESRPYRASDWPELPPTEAPIVSVFDTLRARAKQGDAGAACRLSQDLMACRTILPNRERISRGKPIANLAPFMPHENTAQRALLNRCQGVNETHLGEQYAMLKQTALAGHEIALGMYLTGELFRRTPGAFIDHLDDYRAEAPRMFESAIQQGSLTAAVLPMMANSGAPTPFLPEPLQHNAFELQSLAILAELARPQMPRSADASQGQGVDRLRRESALSEAQFAAAESLARERHRAWQSDPARAQALNELTGLMRQRNTALDINAFCRTGYQVPLESKPPIEWRRAPE